jgi:hypothetical protein
MPLGLQEVEDPRLSRQSECEGGKVVEMGENDFKYLFSVHHMVSNFKHLYIIKH